MADSTSNFYIKEDFNPNFDITWSFQYAVTGSGNATGGFSTFLFNNSILDGGGPYTGLGYSNFNVYSGVKNAVLGICFFSDNTVKILKGNTFTLLSSFSIYPSLSSLVKNTVDYNTIRFNLTDIGRILKISVKDKITDNYTIVGEYNVNLDVGIYDLYKIGFSYASPLKSGENKICLKLKDIHYQGNHNTPTNTISIRPVNVPKEETYYTLESPTSAYIPIGDPEPSITGFILHRS